MISKKSLWVLSVLLILCTGCKDCNLTNPIGPSGGPSGRGSGEVWVSPNVGSRDFADLFSKPDQWSEARKSVTVIGFFAQDLEPNGCDICGDINLGKFLNATPGGAFRWMNQNKIKVAVEVGSVKDCNGPPSDNLSGTLHAIQNVISNGGEVAYVAQDEPFMQGSSSSGLVGPACGYPASKTAEYVKYYMDGIKNVYPSVRVGLIEPYPHESVAEIKTYVEALDAINSKIDFFHMDFDPNSKNTDFNSDIRELQNYFRSKGIPFGIIIVGGNGSSNETATSGEIAQAVRINSIIGLSSQEHILIESWLDFPPTRGRLDQRLYPDNLPESSPVTMMGTVNAILNMK